MIKLSPEEYVDGTIRYRVNGSLHREDGPAVIYSNGDKFWYQNGKFHGDKYWFQNDRYHREDGPAIEYANGDKSWYYNGEILGCSWEGYIQEKFEQWLKLKIFQ